MMFTRKTLSERTRRLLLVEDDSAVALVYRMRLEMDGYEVIHAADGEEALRLASAELPDLVVLDIKLPKVDGFEVLERLRLEPRTAQLAVMVVSNSLVGSPRMDEALTMGALEWLIKSQTTPAQLSERVRYWLEGREEEAEAARWRATS